MVGENYIEIIDYMKASFRRDYLQIEVYVRDLLNLILTIVVEISLLHDQIETP